MTRLVEFLGQFGVAEAGYETGIKWHKLTDLPINSYIGYDGDNYHVFFDCDTSLDCTWMQIATNLFKRTNQGPTGNLGLILRFEVEHRDRFAPFLNELINQCIDGRDPNDLLTDILPRWFLFWDEPMPLLDSAKQVQLFGELEILNNLFPHVRERALDTWRSPHSENDLHDWQGERVHLEAKTSSENPRRLYVSSIDQMDFTSAANNALFLIIVELNRDPEHGMNLQEKVNATREIAMEAGCEDRLNELLSLFGYLDRHGPLYQGKFCIENILQVPIGPLTPIYTSQHLNDNFDNVVKKITQVVDYSNLACESTNADFWFDIGELL